jgi:hypothetical protein
MARKKFDQNGNLITTPKTIDEVRSDQAALQVKVTAPAKKLDKLREENQILRSQNGL